MKNPCIKECPNRSITCHNDCRDYWDWIENERRKKEQIRKQKQKDSQLSCYRIDKYNRLRKKG